MAERTLEERVARLEHRLDELAEGSTSKAQTPTQDWRRTVGMFRGDTAKNSAEIHTAGHESLRLQRPNNDVRPTATTRGPAASGRNRAKST